MRSADPFRPGFTENVQILYLISQYTDGCHKKINVTRSTEMNLRTGGSVIIILRYAKS